MQILAPSLTPSIAGAINHRQAHRLAVVDEPGTKGLLYLYLFSFASDFVQH